MKIEVLHAKGCEKCMRDLEGLRTAAQQVDANVEWKELDIEHSLDYAVDLGILKPPAVAIDGELVFTSLPTPDVLSTWMRSRLKAAS